MKKKKNVDLGEKAIATAHCVGPPPKDMSGKPRPVLVKFETYKDRCQVWDQKAKLKGSTIYIAEDYPAEVELIRKKLYPIMRAANAYRDEAGNRPYQAHLNTDKLIINSRAYTADNLSALPVPIKPENIATKSTQDYVFFWSADSPFSNHSLYIFIAGLSNLTKAQVMCLLLFSLCSQPQPEILHLYTMENKFA